MKHIYPLIIFLGMISFGYGQEIASFSSIANAGCSGTIGLDANLTATGICRGPGIIVNAGATYNSRNWTDTATLDANDYLEWSITPVAGYEIDLTSMDIRYDRSAFGPTNAEIQINTGAGFATIFTDNAVSETSENNNLDLTAYTNITGTITFRLYGYNAGNAAGTIDIEEHTAYLLDKGIIINGSVNAIPCFGSTVYTWEVGGWDIGGTPTINDSVIIDAAYNTATDGNITACTLTVNAGNTLTVGNNSYVEVENDIIYNGTIVVNENGSVVQNSDVAVVTGTGLIQVEKVTAPMNNWYEYTYWSSPVSGETIGSGLSDTSVNRRFSFNAANFLDATAENNNDNTAVAGQDDIDDDGNDWTFEAAANVMNPGVGYAATIDETTFNFTPGFPKTFKSIFEGPFNNGIITVDVYRNDSELNDNNWNFLGNPYPSAIDADAFLAVNSILATDVNHPGALDGAIFLWSQNTPPSDTNNGNQNQNFEASDYAVINAVGQTAGGDGLTPDRYIPSGQGFFVVYSDAATPDSTTGDIAQGQVTFNNSMRVTANNTQFFRSSNSSSQIERLWLDLTSDNGIFNQILVAYANGATNDDDGMAYDTKKNLSTEVAAVLYSRISDSDNKYVIQAKDPSSLNEKETISIGFNTTIEVPTIYSLAIPQTQGDFLDKNDIFLKDNLLNILHNLKDGAYNFTSETGEFNQRFEIVFSRDALSTNNHNVSEKSLIISEQTNGQVNFTLNAAYKMETIQIIDLQGKVIYNLNPNSKQATYNLSNLSQTPYIAKVTLDNKQTIIKKAIKQF